MKRIIILLVLFFSSAIIFPQVKEVTVFSDRALVTRSLIQEGNAGENIFIYKNIPLNFDPDTIRAKGFVTAGSGMKILDIKLVKNYEKPVSDQDKKALQTKIAEKKDRISVLKTSMDRIKNQKKIYDIFNIKLVNETKDDVENGKLNIKQWQDAVKYYEDEIKRLDGEYYAADKEISKINEELSVLDDQYKKYQSFTAAFTIDAYVTYSLKKSGTVEMLLSYLIPGTYWYPVYDCRLDLNSKQIVLEYHAKVHQITGEDWNNVNLTLSTARPDLSGVIPVLNPWELDLYDYENSNRSYKKSEEKESVNYSMSQTDDSKGAPLKRDEGERYNSEIKSQGLAVSYVIQQKVIIPSGSEETKVTISNSIDLKPELSWTIIPRVDNTSFLKGKIINTSEFTLLPGDMNVYVDDSFINKSKIDMINPTQEFYLSLGRDPRITAEFKLDDVNKGTKFGRKFEQRKYKITVSNNSKDDVIINIKDIIPKSLQAKKITIKVINIDPKPNTIDYESICNWDVTINKNSKIVITEEWYVDYPDNQYIQGLE